MSLETDASLLYTEPVRCGVRPDRLVVVRGGGGVRPVGVAPDAQNVIDERRVAEQALGRVENGSRQARLGALADERLFERGECGADGGVPGGRRLDVAAEHNVNGSVEHESALKSDGRNVAQLEVKVGVPRHWRGVPHDALLVHAV